MTWTQVLDQLLAWLQDPPTCTDGSPLGVVAIHVAVEYAKHAKAEGIPTPEAMVAANEGIDLYWESDARFWRANHNGTITAWEAGEWRETT